MKLISIVLAGRLKSIISTIVKEVAYVDNRFISESGRMISDILEVTNFLDIEGLLITVDIEKSLFLDIHVKKMDLATNFENGYKS